MGAIGQPTPVLLILAAFSRHAEALDWAARRAEAAWGKIALASQRFEFRETEYYTPTMGSGLQKCIWAFADLVDPARLAEIKIETNAWELEYAEGERASEQRLAEGEPESRPLNLDPGYVTEAKLVLASTKDHAHRIYLSRGIYAEVTLFYKDRRWQHRDWTFPDYRRDDYQQFFTHCRDFLRSRATQGRRA